jgi:hypothetical protein
MSKLNHLTGSAKSPSDTIQRAIRFLSDRPDVTRKPATSDRKSTRARAREGAKKPAAKHET